MALPLKSKQGCWTCRLRKKKCDEARPACSTCSALAITCYGYGYGARPAWMDDSQAVARALEGFKDVVRVTSRAKGRARGAVTGSRTEVVGIMPKLLEGGDDGGALKGNANVNANGMQRNSGLDTSESLPSEQSGLAVASTPPTATQPSMAGDDSALLMHFLDHVFILQYPLYRPSVLEGGRGWVLSALLRTKPLYHAALATSVHHRRTLMASGLSTSARATALVEQERHLEVAIKAVTERAANACPAVGLDIMLTVVQLVFFEIFAGNSNGWEPHLRATMSMYHRGFSHDMKPFRLAEKSRIILKDDLPFKDGLDSIVSEEVVSFRFLTGTITWLDIVSCITKGTAPFLLPFHSRILSSSSQIDLGKIMGCRNSIMLQIGRIAALWEKWRQKQLREAHMSTLESTPLRQIASDIGRELQYELSRLAIEDAQISETDSNADVGWKPMPGDNPEMLITRLFAYMASIYLKLVTKESFSPSLTNLDQSIYFQAMSLIRERTTRTLLAALVCPLFIIGSMANVESDKQYFRDIFSLASLPASTYQDRAKMLPVLEQIWITRQLDPGFGWANFLTVAGSGLLL